MEVMIDLKILSLFAIFIISLVLPNILSKKFPSKLPRETMLLLKFIKTMIDEDSGRIALNSSIDSKAHPLFSAAARFIDGILEESDTGNYVRTTIPEEFGVVATRSSQSASILFTPLSNANNTFYTTIEKREMNASLILNISDGSAISDWDAYNSDSDKKRVALSCSVEGIIIDAINSKKCLISLEPFLLSAQIKKMNNKHTLETSGVYLFIAIVAALILLLSLCKTLALRYPVFGDFIKMVTE
ncbi:hypothetical protein J5681_03530 [bacterium]|nr:hypothetical protein [bacterium]